MSVKIRLRRTGKRNAPAHRIVVADSRSPRDGRFIENLGMYDPRAKIETIDLERADHWLSQGAQASETVAGIIKRKREGLSLHDRLVEREETARIEAEKLAGKKAEEAAEAAAEAEAAAKAEAAAAAEEEKEEETGDTEEAEAAGEQDTEAEKAE